MFFDCTSCHEVAMTAIGKDVALLIDQTNALGHSLSERERERYVSGSFDKSLRSPTY